MIYYKLFRNYEKIYIDIYQILAIYEKMHITPNLIKPKCNVLWMDK